VRSLRLLLLLATCVVAAACDDAPAATLPPAVSAPLVSAPGRKAAPSAPAVARCATRVLDERSCLEYRSPGDSAQLEKYCRRLRGEFANEACPSEGRAGVCLLPEGGLRHAYGAGEHARYCTEELHGSWGEAPPAPDPVAVVRCQHEDRCEESALVVAAAVKDAKRDCEELSGTFAELPCSHEGSECTVYGRRIFSQAENAEPYCHSLDGTFKR
jgi:hypothetical protein